MHVPTILYIVNVEAAIYNHGKYLMVVRGYHETHAAGTLSLVGGKVENAKNEENVLENTLQREILEEVGIAVSADMEYIESKAFLSEDGDIVVDVVFLCLYESGVPSISDPGEVAEIWWMTAEQVLNHPDAPPWTCNSIMLAERKRKAKGW